jgi:hypothetical protein
MGEGDGSLEVTGVSPVLGGGGGRSERRFVAGEPTLGASSKDERREVGGDLSESGMSIDPGREVGGDVCVCVLGLT